MSVFDNCNGNTVSSRSYIFRSHSSLGHCYANDTGLDGWKVLTGLQNFTVKEIEVFEITN
jgi:hypothetical protein